MAGEESLKILLREMSPKLDETDYVFITLVGEYGDFKEYEPICSFLEEEGLTLIVPQPIAVVYGLDYEGVFRKITLEVHSSLEAVGLTAVVATKLKENNISANVIAGYYHDHIFVQSQWAEKAENCLVELTREGL